MKIILNPNNFNNKKYSFFFFSEFRQYINDNFPFVLDYYYKVGEVIGNSNLREIDATIWRAQEKKE